MLRKIGTVVFVALMTLISACQSQPVTYYALPTGLPLEDSATLVGSVIPIRNIFYADEITYVHAIDDLPVEGGPKNYGIPIQLLPGKHAIQVGFAQGSGCAKASIVLNAQSREMYIARAEKLGREHLFGLENLRIWIEDSKGNVITNDSVVSFGHCGGLGGIAIY